MKRSIFYLIISILLICPPCTALAEPLVEANISRPAASPLIITELQVGTAESANEEFIEVHNTTDAEIALEGWQLWYISATTTAQFNVPSKRIVFEADSQARIPAHGYYLFASKDYLPAIADMHYEFSLANSGTLRLFMPSAETECELRQTDSIGWGAAKFASGYPASVSASRLLAVRNMSNDIYSLSGDNAKDFKTASTSPSLALATPRAANIKNSIDTLPAMQESIESTVIDDQCEAVDDKDEDTIEHPSPLMPVTESPPSKVVNNAADSPARPIFPVRNTGLKGVQVAELLPNPGAPQSDTQDEYIELYNPNNATFELSGFILEVGVTNTKKYIFPQGTLLGPKVFKAWYITETKLALTNMQGQVRLLDPAGRLVHQSAIYASAKDNNAWIFADNAWQWTTAPTPNAINNIAKPTKVKPESVRAAISSSRPPAGTLSNAGSSGDAIEQTATIETPIHPAALAAVGVIAVLYGLYEYRGDVANRVRQFRVYRAARRAHRQKS